MRNVQPREIQAYRTEVEHKNLSRGFNMFSLSDKGEIYDATHSGYSLE